MPDRTLADLAAPFLPDEPRWHLATEPWIDVTWTGADADAVGLGDALRGAHDLALAGSNRGALTTHAVFRLLSNVGYKLFAHSPDEKRWGEVADGRSPLPPEAVDAVLEQLHDLLWLWHPSRPFLQHQPVLASMSPKPHKDDVVALVRSTDPIWAIFPDVPSKSNTEWFRRAAEQPSLTDADIANAVVTRHVFGLPGNEASNHGAGGNRSEGGVAGLTHHGRSLVTITGNTLAQTIARNLVLPIARELAPDVPTFIEEPDEPTAAISSRNAVWMMFASCAATVVVPVPDDPDGYRVVRTPMPWPKEITAAVKETRADDDPHTLRVDAKTKGERRSYLSLPAAGNDLDLVRKFHSDLVASGSPLHPPSVLGEHTTYRGASDEVEVLVIAGAGSSTGPRIETVTRFTPPTSSFATNQVDRRMVRYLDLADSICSKKGAMSRRVGWRARLAIDPQSGRAPSGWYERCDTAMSSATEPLLRELLTQCLDGDRELPSKLSDAQRSRAMEAGIELFDELTAPHQNRPTAVPHIIRQRGLLSAELRN